MPMTVGDLIEKLQQFSVALPVHFEGSDKNHEISALDYNITDVEGWKNEDGQIGVTIYGLLRNGVKEDVES